MFSELFHTCFLFFFLSWPINLNLKFKITFSLEMVNALDMKKNRSFLRPQKKAHFKERNCVYKDWHEDWQDISLIDRMALNPAPSSDTQYMSLETIGTDVTEDIMIMRSVHVHTISITGTQLTGDVLHLHSCHEDRQYVNQFIVMKMWQSDTFAG